MMVNTLLYTGCFQRPWQQTMTDPHTYTLFMKQQGLGRQGYPFQSTAESTLKDRQS